MLHQLPRYAIGHEKPHDVQAAYETDDCLVRLVRHSWSGPAQICDSLPNHCYLGMATTPRATSRATVGNGQTADYCQVGKVILLPSGANIDAQTVASTDLSIECWFARTSELELSPSLATNQHLSKILFDLPNQTIRLQLLRLDAELVNPRARSSELVSAIVRQLAIELGRVLSDLSEIDTGNPLKIWQISAIDQRLTMHGSWPTVSELADLCTVSSRTLIRRFRAAKAITLQEYCSKARIDLARELLAEGRCIKAVAHELGYASPSSFTHAFTRSQNITPGAFAGSVRGRDKSANQRASDLLDATESNLARA